MNRGLRAFLGLMFAGALAACQPTPPPMMPTLTPTLRPVRPAPTAVNTAAAPSAPASVALTPTSGPPTPTPATTSGGGQAAQPPSATPCHIPGELEVYLVVDHQLRHIVDMDTFTNLGYSTGDIADCGASATLPQGGPITRLVKGSGDAVYLMEAGKRRHIPDMATFTSLGYKTEDISVLPDSIVGAWPLGTPLPAGSGGANPPASPAGSQTQIGGYTIRLTPQTGGVGGPYQGVIAQPGQPDITIPDVERLGDLPAADVTGEGDPDVMFLTRSVGSSHCCWGTIIYNLGATPLKVLDMISTPYYSDATGRVTFKDMNGDGSYEILTWDAMTGLPCSQPSVMAVLAYSSDGRYEGAGPRYPYAFAAEEDSLKQSTQPGAICDIYPYIATEYTSGATTLAQQEFDRLYTGSNHDADWEALRRAVEHSRFYVAQLVTAH